MENTKPVEIKESENTMCFLCAKFLTQNNSFKAAVVCQNCWRLLSIAGMNDQQILQLADSPKDKKNKS